MEQRVSIITLGVADLERSRAFYERLGWRPALCPAQKASSFFRPEAWLSPFTRVHELVKDANIATDGHGFGGITLAYNARTRTEVDSVLNEAASRRSKDRQARQGSFLGRLLRIFF